SDQILPVTQHYYVLIGPDIGDILGFSKGFPQSLSLTDRKKRITVVLADDVALDIQKIASSYAFFKTIDPVFQKISIIIIRHEADFIGISLLGQIGVPPIVRHLPDVRFLEVRQRK